MGGAAPQGLLGACDHGQPLVRQAVRPRDPSSTRGRLQPDRAGRNGVSPPEPAQAGRRAGGGMGHVRGRPSAEVLQAHAERAPACAPIGRLLVEPCREPRPPLEAGAQGGRLMGDGARMLDAYLSELRTLLRNLPEPEVSEIEAELRSHVRDSGTRGGLIESEVAATLARLGSPAALASLYDTDRLLVRAGRSRSPWLLLRSLFRWAAVSLAGICVLIPVAGGYLVAASLFMAALVKPFAPDRVGLWRLSKDEVSLPPCPTATLPPHRHEPLGLAVRPLGPVLRSRNFPLARWC